LRGDRTDRDLRLQRRRRAGAEHCGPVSNGLKIAFSENNTLLGTSNFHVLQFKTGAGNGTSATAPAVPGTGNTAVDTKIAFAGGATTGPYVDYAHDVAYLTTNGNSSLVHKITGVFNGTPTEVTTGGWPATIPGNPGVSTPVYDNVSRHVFATDGTGFIDYVDDSVSPAVVHSGAFSFAGTGITAARGGRLRHGISLCSGQ
jgi:hypothetical protein